MIFTAKIQIDELDEVEIEFLHSTGMNDTAIIHLICDEATRKNPPIITKFSNIEFTDCEIKTEKEKEKLPF